ncbi:MAG: hypothetical protein K2H98_04520 [Duncaniella sp.]|nr:hypothetical protein [Duncaniella sp.]
MGKILTFTRIVIFAAAIAGALSGCNTTGCLENRNSIPLAGFYSAATEKAVSVTGLSVMGLDAPGDSLLYTSSQTLSQIYLPLRAREEMTTYVLSFTSGNEADKTVAVDELTFTYTATPWFASEDCGAMYRYHIDRLEYTTRVIQRVELTDSLVTNFNIETIRIYLRDDSQQKGDDR